MVTVLREPPLRLEKRGRGNYDLLSWSSLDASTIARWLTSVWDMAKTKEERRLGIQEVMPMELINRLIMMYSKVGDMVLDPFAGTGSTLASAYALIRKGIGFEIYDDLINMASKRLRDLEEEARSPTPFDLSNRLSLEMDRARSEVDHEPVLIQEDARNADKFLDRESIDLVLTAPPSFKPTPSGGVARLDPRDLASVGNYEDFVRELRNVMAKLWGLLRRRGIIIIAVEDAKLGPIIYPLHIDLANAMKEMGFIMRDIIIWDRRKEYDPKSITGIVHQYIMIMEKA